MEEEKVSRNIMVATAGLQLTLCQVSAALELAHAFIIEVTHSLSRL